MNKELKNDLITIYNEVKLGNNINAIYWLNKYVNDSDEIS